MNDSYTRHACGISAPSRRESAILDAVGVLALVAFVAAKAWTLAQVMGWA